MNVLVNIMLDCPHWEKIYVDTSFEEFCVHVIHNGLHAGQSFYPPHLCGEMKISDEDF